MRMAISIGGSTIDEVVTNAKAAEQAGFHSAWLANIFGLDAMTAIAVAGREVPRIELGTAVVPTYSRHPFYMAQQAMSTQAATGGRFVLGIGLSHQLVIEGILGLSFDKPAKHMREYLTVLNGLLEQGTVTFHGDLYKVDSSFTPLERMGTTPPPVMIAALAPVMLKLAGSMTAGTITWMTGYKTIETHIVPTMGKAAAAAGRPDAASRGRRSSLGDRGRRRGEGHDQPDTPDLRHAAVVPSDARQGGCRQSRRRRDPRRRGDCSRRHPALRGGRRHRLPRGGQRRHLPSGRPANPRRPHLVPLASARGGADGGFRERCRARVSRTSLGWLVELEVSVCL